MSDPIGLELERREFTGGCEHNRGIKGYVSTEMKGCPYCRIEALELDLGLMTIARDQKSDLLASCENALADRDDRIEALTEKYNDLLHQVKNKIPCESRHETAKRIIVQHENREEQCTNQEAGK